MFARIGLSAVRGTMRAMAIPKITSAISVPKFSYSTAIAQISMAQLGLTNPNVMRMLNLRELILKSKS